MGCDIPAVMPNGTDLTSAQSCKDIRQFFPLQGKAYIHEEELGIQEVQPVLNSKA